MYTKAKSIADIKAIFSTDNLAVSYILLEREYKVFFSEKEHLYLYFSYKYRVLDNCFNYSKHGIYDFKQ